MNVSFPRLLIAATLTNSRIARAYAVMPFVWSIGTIVGPAIGGYFSNPSENFPSLFTPDGSFARFPYLLPNVICASLLLVAIVAGFVAIEETHPDKQPWTTQETVEPNAEIPFNAQNSSNQTAPADLSTGDYGTFNAVDVQEEENWYVKRSGRLAKSKPRKVFTKRVVMLVVALGIFTYHSMTYDHLLPIFLQDDRYGDTVTQTPSQSLAGGLGLSIQDVGIIMAFNGVIALFIQAVIFPYMATWLGIWKLFLLVTFGHPVSYFIIPYLTLLPNKLIYPGIYFCLSVRNFFSILAYPILLILLKEATPAPAYLGKINGLAASTGAGCRTIASPVAGFLYGVGVQIGFTPLAWWASSIVAIIGAIQVFWVKRQKDMASVKTLAHHISRDSLKPGNPPQREVVYITVSPIREESEESDLGSDEEQGLLSGSRE